MTPAAVTDDDRRHLVTTASSSCGSWLVPIDARARLLRMKLVEIVAAPGVGRRATLRLTDRGREEMCRLLDRASDCEAP